jgi:hypothetical protein
MNTRRGRSRSTGRGDRDLPDECEYNPNSIVAQSKAAQTAGAVCLADVCKGDLKWLWPGRIPLGSISLLVGDPGLGKSLVSLDIAARVTRGAPWPDEQVNSEETRVECPSCPSGSPLSTLDSRPPASVLLLTAEDDLADTVRPRLEALGADCSRVMAVPALVPARFHDMLGQLVDLGRDLHRVGNLLAAEPDCRLIIIDPVNAYVGSGDVQRVLLPFADIARRHDVAVLAVGHSRKKGGAAIHSALGSLAYVSTARSAWLIRQDPQNADRRLFLPLKNNLAASAGGLS